MAKERAELTTDDKFELVLSALASAMTANKGLSKEDLAEILAANANAVQRAIKPENTNHPGFSALSYPEGDTARPREGILQHEFLIDGYPLHKFPETEHWLELEWAAKIRPGVYKVLRSDHVEMTVTVTGEHDANGNLTKVSVATGRTRENKNLIPPKYVMFRQMLNQDDIWGTYAAASHEWTLATLGSRMKKQPVGV
jgi:hypothetical protein